jgi:hypothetical protein
MTDEKKPGFVVTMGSGRSTMDLLAPGIRPIEITDPIGDVPVVQGPHGRAWLCDTAAGLRKMNIKPEDNGSLDFWIVEAPWAHPAWHSYSIMLLHLREMPGKPAYYHIKDATHEIHVYAMDPTKDRRDLLATGIVNGHWMSPGNFAAQFIEIMDELARERVRNTVQMICDGRLSPDTDFLQDWIRLYNNSMIRKEYRR